MIHTITHHNPYLWDTLLQAQYNLASQNPVPGVPQAQAVRNVHYGWWNNGREMAIAIANLLDSPQRPKYVMIDELRVGSIIRIADCASYLRQTRPDLAGQWGAYVVNGSGVRYNALNPAITELLLADALIGVELYYYTKHYLHYRDTQGDGAADVKLAEFQSLGPYRFKWLMQERKRLGSKAVPFPLFGVIDRMLDPYPAHMIDRMFYTWVNRSGYRTWTLNTGVGSWKWDLAVSNTSRDFAFWKSHHHYIETGQITSRMGRLP